jgi:superfamily II DNA or RNA helicase
MNKHKKTEETIEWPQHLNTYLGNKGYTILKSELPIRHQVALKEWLMVKPFMPGSPVQVQKTFPAYRESDKKIYIPRYFGEKHFGEAKTIKITEGDDIQLTFQGTLRDYQVPVVQSFIDYIKSKKTIGGLLELPCAWGKTSASLYICSQLKKKTLVIVHKEFLMNQWIERINQFIPSARVGKIQGQIIDIENKDIVIAMLQSLSKKDYPSNLFDCFGFTIIDEVHHISAEMFSCALFKLVTKYMLGLSATMDRKDGTTKIFKMFLGEVVHKVERKDEHNVQVRAITFKTNDEEFNETILDWKGNPQISSMISKLCSYNKRTEFIVKVLTDFIEVDGVDKTVIETHKKEMDSKNPNCEICFKKDNYLIKNTCCDIVKYCLPCMQQIENSLNGGKKVPKCPTCNKRLKYEQNYIENPYIKPLEQLHTLILSHNLNVLHYIYNKFVCKNIASIGYYVGGMKEPELKKTEKKQIILASFSMASEALDIPSLNAEFLITPKTDIVQSVGRILRAKHSFSGPIIYDIKDSHGIFEKQWAKRKAYYKKQNYNIVECDSYNYQKDISKWKTTCNNPQTKKIKTICKTNKTSSRSSKSSDKSIAEDTDEDLDEEDELEEEKEDLEEGKKDLEEGKKEKIGICLLKFKK